MIKPFDLLMGVLNEIEERLKDDISAESLAAKYSLSSSHLQHLFQFTFGQSIGTYIRLRKLSSSIEDLLYTDKNILDIAIEYGLEYEQSYIRSFKKEFGVTPGQLRKSGQVLKIKPPLQLFDSNRLNDGVSFGPDIVMIPKFYTIGKKYKIPTSEIFTIVPILINHFYNNERKEITNPIEHNEVICIATSEEKNADYVYYMPSVHVKSLDNIPAGFDHFTFPSSLCARFHFIGPEKSEINVVEAKDKFKDKFLAIDDFINNKYQGYLLKREITIDRIYPAACFGKFKLWEWFTPVVKKT